MRSGAAFLLAALVGAGSAGAQEKPKTLQKPAPATDKEKADAAEEAVAQMREVLKAVSVLAEKARTERDVLRLNCINERKTSVSGLLKVAELSLEDLRAALRDRQPEAVDHEFAKISIAAGKVANYKNEAEQCIGLLAFYESEQVERDFVDENTLETAKQDPTTQKPPDPPPNRSPAASPVR